jgi:1,4-dihydroxy-2-naphthoate octaprenyltransferase
MKDLFNREPVKRALRTFMQTAAGYIAANIAVAVTDMENNNAIKALFAAAVAAGIAAVMNMENIDDQNNDQNNDQNGGGDK